MPQLRQIGEEGPRIQGVTPTQLRWPTYFTRINYN